MRKETLGFSAVIAAAFLWGVGGSVAKFLFNQSVSPFLLVKVRLTLSYLLLLAGVFCYNRHLLVIRRRDIPYFAVLGMGGMAFMQFSYFFTISLTNVATAVFLQYLSPVLMAAYAVLWEKEKFTFRGAGAVALAMLGGLFILLNSGGVAGLNWMGIISGVSSAFFMAFCTIYGRRAVRSYHPLTAAVYSFGFGALAWWMMLPELWEAGSITAEHWYMFWYVAVFSTVLPFLLYFTGMRYLPPTSVGIIACLEPVIAAAVAYAALGEKMGVLQMLGGLLVLTAVVIVQTQGKQPDKKHESG